MTEAQVIAFLRLPASPVVDLAIQVANLTWKEALAVDLCGRKAMTQEKASEQAGYSVDAVQRWYKKGMKKLCTAWDGIWWIDRLSDAA